MTTMVWVYLSYLVVCVLVTILVARTLKIHGAVFITGSNDSPSPIAQAKTHLLVVGFYLICIGLIGFALRIGGDVTGTQEGIELIASKVGGMVLFIGFMHFSMVGIFASVRKEESKPRPVFNTHLTRESQLPSEPPTTD